MASFERILQDGEGISVEFKRCGGNPGSDTFETICAFANRQGGTVFLGVENDGTVLGVDPKRGLDVQREIVNVVNNPRLFNSPPAVELETFRVEDKAVVRIWVPVSSIVHSYKNVVYDRVADADIKLITDSQLSAVYARKQGYYSERKVFRYLETSDLRLDLLARVREMARAKRADHPWASMSDEALLRSANLYLKDYETGEEGFTLAAALLLGKDEVISSMLPSYKTDAYVQLIDKDRYDDRVIIKTNLIEAYDGLLAFVRKHLPDKFFVEGIQSISLRDLLARELISNTLMHREYSSPFPAKLVIDGQGLRTENASRPRTVGALSPDRFNPLPKNPIIAEFFTNIGLADALGSGTRNLFKYSWAYGGAQPKLTDGDVFEAIVPLAPQKEAEARGRLDVDATIERMLDDYGFATVAVVASVSGVTERTARRHIASLVSSGEIEATGNTKDRRYVRRGRRKDELSG